MSQSVTGSNPLDNQGTLNTSGRGKDLVNSAAANLWMAKQMLFIDDPQESEDEMPVQAGISTSSQDEDEDAPQDRLSCLSPFILRESNNFRKVWELALLFMLIYIGIVFPWRLAFLQFRLRSDPDADCETYDEPFGFEVWEQFISSFFWIDLVLNFFLTYRTRDGVEVTAPCQIAGHYLKNFFLLNLLACLPPEAFTPLIEVMNINPGGCPSPASANRAARLARLQRVTRLARLARLLRIVKVASFLQKSAVAQCLKMLRSMRLVNWFFFLGWVVHLMSCGWYLCAAMHEDHFETWPNRRQVNSNGDTLLQQGPWEQWAHAMYFVLTVFSTVGFGDMSAVTLGEIVYVICTMMVGAIVHSIIISEMINLISEVDEDTKWKRGQMQLLESYSRHAGLDAATRDRLTGWVSALPAARKTFDPEEMRRLLTCGRMPRKLLGEMPERLFEGQLLRSKLLKACAVGCLGGAMPPRFSLLLSTMLSPSFYKEGDVVFELHDHAFNIYLVMSGTFAYVGEATERGGMDVVLDSTPIPQSVSESKTSRGTSGVSSLAEQSVDTTPDVPRVMTKACYIQSQDGHLVAIVNPLENHRSYSSGPAVNSIHSTLGQKRGAWSPNNASHLEGKEWLQINLGMLKTVSGVAIQGHPSRDEWLTKIKVYVSWGATGSWREVEILPWTCADRDTKVEILFQEPTKAQFVRIEPQEWHGDRASLRAAVLVLQQRLFPYAVVGRHSYFGEDVLLGGNRCATVRCEADAQVMLLSKQDLTAAGTGARLLKEFPQFARVLRSECLRREAHRRHMLRKLRVGHSYKVLAVRALQAAWRKVLWGKSQNRLPGVDSSSARLQRPPSASRMDRVLTVDRESPAATCASMSKLEAKVDRLASELFDFRADLFQKVEAVGLALERVGSAKPESGAGSSSI